MYFSGPGRFSGITRNAGNYVKDGKFHKSDQILNQTKRNIKSWFRHMRLTYSHIYSYENKFNLIGGNALNNLKKK